MLNCNLVESFKKGSDMTIKFSLQCINSKPKVKVIIK